MSTQYPILDNRPINKWKVAELKEELKRRNLPTKGLKDDLVKRLDGAIRNERAAAEAREFKASDGESQHVGNFGETKVESSPFRIANEALKHRGLEVQKIHEAVTGLDIDDGPTKIDQGEALKREETVSTEPITITGEPSVVEVPPAISNIQDRFVLSCVTPTEGMLVNKILSQDNAVLECSQKDAVLVDEPVTVEATVQSIGEVVDSQIRQTLDDKNIKTHNDEVEGTDLPTEKAVENIEDKPGDISLNSSQQDAVLVGEPVTLETTVKSIVDVADSQVCQKFEHKDIKICNEVEGTDLPPEKAAENIEVKPEDVSLKSSHTDADRGEPYSSDQVYEVSHNLGLQVKSESFSNDALTVNEKKELKENLTADNVQLEPEIIRPEMVQPSSSRDPPGDGIVHPSDDPVPHGNQTLDGETDDDKSKNIEFSKKNDNADEMSVGVSMAEHNLECEATEKVECDNELNQMSFVKDISPVSGFSPAQREPSAEGKIDVATSGEEKKPQDDNDFSKTTDGVDGDLLEKVNFDQSSGDDSMEEDMSEMRHVDSDHISSKVGQKTVLSKEPGIDDGGNINVMQHITPSDKLESSNAHKDGAAALSEKRKFQDATEAEEKEPPKRQRRWNTESQEVPESQSSGAILSPKPKASLLTASTMPNLTRSNSKLGEEAPVERVVPPSQKTPTTSLRIDNFLRPFTLKAVQELLAKTGTVSSFWMDHIKTHCYVSYSSVEEAIETRNAVYNLQWPPNGGRHLIAEFADPEEVKLRVDTPPQSAAPSVNTSAVTAQAPSQPAAPTPRQVPRQQHEPHHPLSRQPPVRDSLTMKEQLPRAPSPVAEKADPPIVTLDDLFRKTRATPRIYYLPLSDEQVAAKLARQRRDRQ